MQIRIFRDTPTTVGRAITFLALVSLATSVPLSTAFADDTHHNDRYDTRSKQSQRGRGRTLKPRARRDLARTGLTQYLGDFRPSQAESLPEGWTSYTFDSDGGQGPICIDGSDFRVFVQERSHEDVVIFLNGGGACWQGAYNCAFSASTSPPGPSGIFSDSLIESDGAVTYNPFKTFSKVFVSYCDGSVFAGDNEVADLTFPGGPVRYHRGVRNISAAFDLTESLFPYARNVLLTGASAGGYGATGLSAALVRFVYPEARIRFFNDSGPLNNPAFVSALTAQAEDWQTAQFVPRSCPTCSPFNQPSEIIKWWLANDRGLRAGLFSFDGDAVIRFFTAVPTAAMYRSLLLDVHDPINARFPRRYKRFIVNGEAHTIVGGTGFYLATVNDIPLYEWLEDLVRGGRNYVDLVAPAVP
ncbi:MAG: pectin acetylesterase-family hydrolase [Myxococcota bacterium]